MMKKLAVILFILSSPILFLNNAFSQTDSLALVALYNATNGDNWTNNTNWLSDEPIGDWYGVSTDGDGFVIGINLYDNNLVGVIAPDLGTLSNLNSIMLSANQLSGNIPPELGNLSNLQYLYFDINQLTGNIPPELGDLSNLISINLNDNQLTGNIPTELGSLSNIQGFNFGENQLSGSIPLELGNLSNLQELLIYSNQLSGSIPSELGNLTSLTYMNLGDNQLSGSIPPDLGDLLNLQELYIYSNELSGSIPSELGNLSNLNNLGIRDNQLSGTIPSEIGNLSGLVILLLNNNDFVSPIPSELCADLQNITELSLHGNLFTSQDCEVITCLLNQGIETFQHSPQSNGFSFDTSCETTNSDSLALVALYNATDGDNWTDNTNWLTGAPLGDWFGVTVNSDGKVNEISLSWNNLNGSIPSEIGDLQYLGHINLNGNNLPSDLPIQIANLELLEFLSIQQSNLIGIIPPELGNMPNLKTLRLNINELSGIIPEELCNLGNLEILQLEYNQLSGTIPLAIGNLQNLQELSLGGNLLSGFIPSGVGDLISLETLFMSTNQFEGTLPTELSSLQNLTYWSFSDCQFDSVPPSYINLNIPGLEVFFELNQFSFEDLINLPPNATYNPQKTIHAYDTSYLVANTEGVISLSFDENVLNSTYIWKKDGSQIAITDSNSFLRTESTAGTFYYTVEITNIDFPDFVLNVDSIIVVVNEGITERDALIALYNATDGDNWTDNTNWLSDEPIGDWFGVTADVDNHVTEIIMTSNNLNGALPSAIEDLTYLSTLRLDGHQLIGEIPVELYAMPNLVYLNLSNNQLSGELSPLIGSMPVIESYLVYNNEFTGIIPIEIGNSETITHLDIGDQGLTGEIPVELASLTNLNYLAIRWAGLTGEIPVELYSLENMEFLYLDGNELSGEIPPEIGLLTILKNLWISYNNFSGTIPPEIGNLTALTDISIKNNVFDEFPSELANLVNVSGFGEYNDFTFEDLENFPSSFTYAPQNTIHAYDTSYLVANTEGVVSLGFDENVLNSTYIWKKDGSQIAITDSNSFLRTESTAGTFYYTVEITNIDFPDFVLNVDSVIVVVNEGITERDALIALYNATDGDNWTDNTNWLSDEPLGNWYGVDTDVDANVISIILNVNNLNGNLPGEIGDLTFLEGLEIAGNNMVGNIPIELTTLANLTSLQFNSNEFSGNIPTEIGNLTNLQNLVFYDNNLSGSIPSELGNLVDLEVLNLGSNQLTGSIPSDLGNLASLLNIDLGNNQLSGNIPSELSNLISIEEFYLDQNQLSGNIPSELNSLVNLYAMFLGSNLLSGSIPSSLGDLTNLSSLLLSDNQLSGSIPPELGNLTNLQDLRLLNNQLSGNIPSELGNLTGLQVLYLNNNQLSGTIPSELGNISNLAILELSNNLLESPIPYNICTGSVGLMEVGLQGNMLTAEDCSLIQCIKDRNLGSFNHSPQSNGFDFDTDCETANSDSLALVALYNATDGDNWTDNTNWLGNEPIGDWYGVTADVDGNVTKVILEYNNLSGTLPSDIGNLTSLTEFILTGNLLSGNIPIEIGSLLNLQRLELNGNQLIGIIPLEVGSLINLSTFYLQSNQLTGSIPTELSNLVNLTEIMFSGNQLSGVIPYQLGSLINLEYLHLDVNQLNGTIPPELGGLSNLTSLNLQHNQLTGSIPLEISALTNLTRLYLYANELSGTIPIELQLLENLQHLYIDDNQVSGGIPIELGNLISLTSIKLDNNQLTGTIPVELSALTNLVQLSLKGNQLTGSIPVEFENLLNIEEIILNDNQLTGTIPNEFGNLTNLTYLEFSNNQLESPIPTSICSGLPNLTNVYFQNNLFSEQDCEEIECLSMRSLNEFQHSPQSNGFNFNTDCSSSAISFTEIITNVLCFGDATGVIELIATGGNYPYEYSINGGVDYQTSNIFSELNAGTYSVFVKDDNNLSTSHNVTISEPDTELSFTETTTDIICFGESTGLIEIIATGGTPDYEYSINNGLDFQTSNLFENLIAGDYTLIVRDANACSDTNWVSISEPEFELSFTETTTDILCFGESTGLIEITATGGTPDYEYSINNGLDFQTSSLFENLIAGDYTLIVRDANACSDTNWVSILEPEFELSFTETTTDILCFGESTGLIEITATGGTPDYEYSINNGLDFQTSNLFENLIAGDYTLIVRDANACSDTNWVSISEPEFELIFTETTTDILCFGESAGVIEITATGGTPDYEYSINNGLDFQTSNLFENLIAGEYILIVRDANACSDTNWVSISEPEFELIFTETTTDILCFGESAGVIEITATGGTPDYEYSINNGADFQTSNIFTSLSAGTYLVMVKDANECISNHDVILSEPELGLSFTENTTDVLCFGESNGGIEILAIGGMSPYLYSIDNGQSYQESNVFEGLLVGAYDIVILDNNGCTHHETINVTGPTALSFTEEIDDLLCFGDNTGIIEITVVGGVPEYEYSIDNGINFQTSPLFENLSSDVYLLLIKDNNNCESSHEATIMEPEVLSITIETIPVTCFGGSDGEIVVSAEGGTPNYEYSIDGGLNYQSSPLFDNLVDGEYVLNITDANNCEIGGSATVIEPDALPIVSFEGLEAVYCIYSESILLTGNQAPEGNFEGAGITDNGDGTAWFSPQAAGIGLQEITYYYTSPEGCYNSESQSTQINALLDISIIDIEDYYCFNAGAVLITGSEAPNGSFSGIGIVDNGNGTAYFNPEEAGIGGPYSIIYSYTYGDGCYAEFEGFTEVLDIPIAMFIGLEESYCVDIDFVQLTSNHYQGLYSGPGILDAENGTAVFNPNDAGVGIHQIQYEYTDPNGCTDTDEKVVEVFDYAEVSFTGLATAYCSSSDPVILTGSEAPLGVFSGPGISNNGDGTATFNPSLLNAGNDFDIVYTYQEEGQCENEYQQVVSILEETEISFEGLNASYCDIDESYLLTGNMAPEGYFSGEGIEDLNNGTAEFDLGSVISGQEIVITYYYENDNGCLSSTSQQSIKMENPIANFEFIQYGCNEATIFMDQSYSENGDIITWAWDFDDPLSGVNNTSDIQNPNHNFLTNLSVFNIELKVGDVSGCESIIEKPITPYPSTMIQGIVETNTGELITDGQVMAFYISEGQLSSIADIVNIQEDGTYIFENMSSCVEYILHGYANPDIYTQILPSWYEDAYYWYNADPVMALWDDDSVEGIDIILFEQQVIPTGNSSVSGGIYYIGSKGEPVKNVDVILEFDAADDKYEGVSDFVYSGDNGSWKFEDLPNGSFKIKVDMPGLRMDSTYHMSIDAPDTHISGLNYYVDTLSGIYIIISGVEELSQQAFGQIAIYPNPNTGLFSLEVSKSEGQVEIEDIEILDMEGRFIKRIPVSYKGVKYERLLDLKGLQSGIYLLKLKNKDDIGLRKFVIQK